MTLYELIASLFRIASTPIFMVGRVSNYIFASVSRMIFRSDHGFLPSSQKQKALSSASVPDTESAISIGVDASAELDKDNLISVVVDVHDSATEDSQNASLDTPSSKQRKLDEDTMERDTRASASPSHTSKVSQWNSPNRRKWKPTPNQEEEDERSVHRMNHFIAFRISDPQIIQNVTNVQAQMMSKTVQVIKRKRLEKSSGEVFKDSLIPSTKLHFTLHVMALRNEEETEKAKIAVGRAWDMCKDEFKRNPITALIKGMGHFGDNVLFAKMQGADTIARLTDLANQIRLEFESLEIPGETRPFAPHMTVAKILKSKKLRNMGIRTYPRELWKDYEGLHFGYEQIQGIQLLSMQGKDPEGYYPLVADFKID